MNFSSRFLQFTHKDFSYWLRFKVYLYEDENVMKCHLYLTNYFKTKYQHRKLQLVYFMYCSSRQPPGYKPQFRNFETELLNMSNVTNTAYNLVTNIGLEPSDDPPCNKLKFCETESSGLGGKSHHSVTNYGLWHLLSRYKYINLLFLIIHLI